MKYLISMRHNSGQTVASARIPQPGAAVQRRGADQRAVPVVLNIRDLTLVTRQHRDTSVIKYVDIRQWC